MPDDRPRRLLARTPVPEDHKARLLALLDRAQAALGDELGAEFGREHVGLIAGCNQFARLWRGGHGAGLVELWLEGPAKQALQAAGFTLHEPEGAVFRLLGWVRVDPMEGGLAALEAALDAAAGRAQFRQT